MWPAPNPSLSPSPRLRLALSVASLKGLHQHVQFRQTVPVCLFSLFSFSMHGGNLSSDPVKKSSREFQEEGNMNVLAYFNPHRDQLEMSDDSCV